MNESVGLDFARSIKAFMRSDPDVIILGEIRDTVAASKAIQAAETGHLVIATIHAESVPMALRSEEHTSELKSLMRISYAVFCLKKKNIEYSIILFNYKHTTIKNK